MAVKVSDFLEIYQDGEIPEDSTTSGVGATSSSSSATVAAAPSTPGATNPLFTVITNIATTAAVTSIPAAAAMSVAGAAVTATPAAADARLWATVVDDFGVIDAVGISVFFVLRVFGHQLIRRPL